VLSKERAILSPSSYYGWVRDKEEERGQKKKGIRAKGYNHACAKHKIKG